MTDFDRHGTAGKSLITIIEDITSTKSLKRLGEYARVFHNDPHHLARYFQLAGNTEDDWEFYRYSEKWKQWILNSKHRECPAHKDLIFFAHSLQQPYETAAAWAPHFLYGAERETRLEIRGNRLRPFVQAGMPPEHVASILYHGLPTGIRALRGKDKLDNRLRRADEFTKMYGDGIPIEYIIAGAL